MQTRRLTFTASVFLVLGTGWQSTHAAAPASAQGTIRAQVFTGIGGTAIADLTNNVKFPTAPGIVRYEPYFELWAGGDINTAAANSVLDNYGTRMVGYFYPPTSGDYTFYLSADDNASLYLSPDDNPANKKLIAVETVWSNPREYTTSGGASALESKRSDQFTGTEWPTKNTITLQAGKPYYIEALQKEGGGGDNLSVSIDGTSPIPGANLSPFDAPTTPTILAQPQSAAVLAGGNAAFNLGLDLPPGVTLSNIVWQLNGTALPNSDTNAFTFAPTAAQNGGTIQAIVTTSAGTLTSSNATLNVATLTSNFTPGVVKFEAFNDISGTAVDALTSSDKYTSNKPDDVRLLPAIDTPNGYGDNYGARVSGFIIPPESGSYSFFLRSDDASQLWLSTDENASNATLIAEETGCCQAFLEPNADQGTAWHDNGSGLGQTTLTPINLTAGKRYAFYLLLKEGGGGDYAQVAARKTGDNTPAAALPPLGGAWIGADARPSLGDPQITTQPQSLPQVIEGRTARLSVGGSVTPTGYNFPLLVQWQKNGVDIPGANSSELILRNAAATNSGVYRAVVTAPSGKTLNSSEATVNVVPDTFPPALAKVGSIQKTNQIEIGIGFDEAVDPVTAGTAANYTLSKGTVTAVRYEPYATPIDAGASVDTGAAVVLATSGLSKGDSVTVTVTNVKDLKNNAIPAAGASKTVTITSKMNWVQVGGTDFATGSSAVPTGFDQKGTNYYSDVVALGNDKDFDLISGSSANWNNYDEASFAYEEVTGDFDRVLRVEYQDPSSQWARAGIMARKALDANVSRAEVEGGYQMSQAMIVRVNPTVQWNGAAGNNSYEWVWRDTDGGNYANSGGGGTPAYPNAWLRLQRSGQNFTGYSSSDGVKWANIGTHTFPADTPIPDKLYVGPYFAPELINNDAWKIGHSVVAKFRDYGAFGGGGGNPNPGDGAAITWALGTGGNLTLTFQGGRLQVATHLGPNADWKDVTNGASPYQVNTTSAPVQYYRIVSP